MKGWLGAAALLLLGAAAVVWVRWPDPQEERLRPYVHARPPVPIVFTSRRGLASLMAAAPEGEGYTYPGQPLWQAEEGRLRLLTAAGAVRELTWERPLADGGTLIDVMSPNVSPDGQTIVFAGRRPAPDPGHFRLYEVRVDGTGLRQLTGGPGDSGCTAVPPLRYRNEATLADEERRTIDYDDVDPVSLGANGRVVFVSSRIPDLCRGPARRVTTLWLMNLDGSGKRPLTASRSNDRWPYLLANGYILFSLWSYNREVITADERDIRPYEPGLASATQPTDIWFGAFRTIDSDRLGALIKPSISVWRPRPLFNGRLVFMTTGAEGALRVVQAEPGVLTSVPSARPADQPLPRPETAGLHPGPALDQAGRAMSFATPSPCPPHAVVLAGAPASTPGAYGLYLADDNWRTTDGTPADAKEVGLQLLFDDPDLVDAEPVAVYRRTARGTDRPSTQAARPVVSQKMTLVDGTSYFGPAGQVFNSDLYINVVKDLPGQQTDVGEGPIFDGPPAGSIDHIRIWAARRDRFDDPVQPRVPGAWELLLKLPAQDKSLGGWLPAGVPTVLAAFTREGRVLRWTTAAKDRAGRQATFYGYAGDHYSGMAPGGQVFCIGCHPGHSGLARSDHDHAERLR